MEDPVVLVKSIKKLDTIENGEKVRPVLLLKFYWFLCYAALLQGRVLFCNPACVPALCFPDKGGL